MNNAEQIKSTQWLEHLRGLSKLERNIGKKVAFDTCADMLEQQQAQIDEATKRGDEILKELCETQAKLASVALTGSPYDQEALAQRDLANKIEALEQFSSIPSSVADHWCNKEINGFMSCHGWVMNELKKLREQLKNGG